MPNFDSPVPQENLKVLPDLRGQRVALLLGKAATTGAADTELAFLAAQLAATGVIAEVRHAYSEQGSPSLREALTQLAHAGVAEVVLLPLLIPMEPGYRLWIARSIDRWSSAAAPQVWPPIRIGNAPALAAGTQGWLSDWLAENLNCAFAETPPRAPAGSIVPPQQRRVLVCQGGPCNDAGAAVVWAHLRAEQKRLNLRTTGIGVMTCKTTCLGPCNLAPVLQVFPEGTYYGGVDEAGVDQIIEQHLLGARVAEELAYLPLSQRQALRQREHIHK